MSVIWTTVGPLGNTSPFVVFINAGASGFFVAITAILALGILVSFLTESEVEEAAKDEQDDDTNK